jgi:hypothetical protein
VIGWKKFTLHAPDIAGAAARLLDLNEVAFLATVSASGDALSCDADIEFRHAAASAMGFATGVDQHHILFEFTFDRALWTQWLDFGTPGHRPKYVRWNA